MVTVFTKFPIKTEFFEQYSKHLKEAVKLHKIEEQEGFLQMQLLAPQNMPHAAENNSFIIVTTWKDMPSFIAYTKSEAFAESHKNMPSRDWFAGSPSVEIFENIDQ